MKWLLILIIAWADPLPATVLQVPIENEALCYKAARKAHDDLKWVGGRPVYSGFGGKVSGVDPTAVPPNWRMPQMTATCIRISN